MPDGSVYDPNEVEQPYGFVKVKCPYSVRDRTPGMLNTQLLL